MVDISKVRNLKPHLPPQTSISDHQEKIPDAVMLAVNKTNEINAKIAELNQWKSLGVYPKISDQSQECISLRWLIKEKLDNNGVQTCKARLCVRGFEKE